MYPLVINADVWTASVDYAHCDCYLLKGILFARLSTPMMCSDAK